MKMGKSMGVQQVPDRVSGFGFSLIFNRKRRFLSVPTGNQESSFRVESWTLKIRMNHGSVIQGYIPSYA